MIMELKIEEANQLITDFDKETDGWKRQAQAAWDEIKHQRDGMPYRKGTKKARKFPLWYSTMKVRQPILYSSTPSAFAALSGDIDDKIRSTQARIIDVLCQKHVKLSPFDRVMQASRDDLLQANIGVSRILLQAKTSTRAERIEVEQVEAEDGSLVFVDKDGEPLDPELVQESGEGYFIEGESTEEIEQETATIKAVCWSDFGWDYESKDFNEWDYCFFRSKLSTSKVRQMLKEVTGEEYDEDKLKDSLPPCKEGEYHKASAKHDVVELWHRPSMKRYIFSKGAAKYVAVDDDPYELPGFFPLPMPLFDNLSTDCMIPTTEHSQVASILQNIDEIFQRIASATRLARARGLYDSAIPEMSKVIKAASEGDYIAIDNLATKLKDGQIMIQYVDISPILGSLSNLYQALAQELQRYDELTNLSDIARGKTDASETATAQGIKSQFVLNRYKQSQADVQRFARDNIRLSIELAIAQYSDERIYDLVYQELDKDDRSRFYEALKRLRTAIDCVSVEIETNSTIAVDENQEKASAIEFANTLGQYLQTLTQIVTQAPFLTEISVKAIKKVVRSFRVGRQFEDEMDRAVDGAIQQAQQMQKTQPGPTLDEKKLAVQQQKINQDGQIAQAKISMEGQSTMAELKLQNDKLQLEGMIAQMNSSIEAQKLQMQQQDAAFKRYIEQATLELKKTIESLGMQEKFVEERRLGEKQLIPNEPDTIIVPPQQTSVITPQALTVDGV